VTLERRPLQTLSEAAGGDQPEPVTSAVHAIIKILHDVWEWADHVAGLLHNDETGLGGKLRSIEDLDDRAEKLVKGKKILSYDEAAKLEGIVDNVLAIMDKYRGDVGDESYLRKREGAALARKLKAALHTWLS
jgi:hypothetical protein